MMKIGVDLISGESPVEELIEGCVEAAVAAKDIEIVMIGRGDVYRPLLEQKKYARYSEAIKRISILEASDVITMDDDPIAAVKQKKNASIVVGLQAHKRGEIDAFFSPGNTGALVLASALIMGRVKGVKKPALVAYLPNTGGGVNYLMDVGASPECTVEDLVKFAIMGTISYGEQFGKADPQVALLNIGQEPHKGTDLAKSTHARLSEMPMKFIGNVEGRDLFTPGNDVIVCDGNIGNITLKTIEGTAKNVNGMLKTSIKSSLSAMLALPLYKGALKQLKSAMDPEKHGGVPILGINGNVFKGHGNSGREAIKYGILVAAKSVKLDILAKINARMEELHEQDKD